MLPPTSVEEEPTKVVDVVVEVVVVEVVVVVVVGLGRSVVVVVVWGTAIAGTKIVGGGGAGRLSA